MAVKEMKCPKCGAPLSPGKNTCSYCKTHYIKEGESLHVSWYEIANEDNIGQYVKWLWMRRQHILEADPDSPVCLITIEEVRNCALKAHEHLTKEGMIQPRIIDLHERYMRYFEMVLTRKVERIQAEQILDDF